MYTKYQDDNMKKKEFLTCLTNELIQYNLIADTDSSLKREKKQYIDGLMTASHYFGISLEELNAISHRAVNEYAEQSFISDLDHYLDTPAVIDVDPHLFATNQALK